MPKKLPDKIDDELLRHIKDGPEGIGIDALFRLLGGDVSRRSLQRRLSKLVATGLLISEGKGRSTRYVADHFSEFISESQPEFVGLPEGLTYGDVALARALIGPYEYIHQQLNAIQFVDA